MAQMTENLLDTKLADATKKIGASYFSLPVAGLEDSIYRERVYCYELYHQLRSVWGDMAFTLSAEVDKAGNPSILDVNIKQAKPDFIVHIPGQTGPLANFAVIEVKQVTAQLQGLKKDIRNLLAFRQSQNYRRAIYLFYGKGDMKKVFQKIHRFREFDISEIEIWWHPSCGQPANKYNEET